MDLLLLALLHKYQPLYNGVGRYVRYINYDCFLYGAYTVISLSIFTELHYVLISFFI